MQTSNIIPWETHDYISCVKSGYTSHTNNNMPYVAIVTQSQ